MEVGGKLVDMVPTCATCQGYGSQILLLMHNENFLVLVRALEFGLTRRVRSSRPASACSFFKLRLNLEPSREVPDFLYDGVHIICRQTSGQSRVYQATQLRADGVHCREFAGTGPVVLKVVPVTGAAFSGFTMDHLMCVSLFPHRRSPR